MRFVYGLVICLLTLGLLSPSSLQAQEKPVQLSLLAPIQIFPEEAAIKGFRLNLLYGRNVSVKGIDLGLINHTTTGVTKGWQLGLVGVVDADFEGFQENYVNITKGHFKGFQWGFYNQARDMHGFQLGLINYAQTGYGLQIGLINIIKQKKGHPVLPIVNWTF
jgi:hypothetical protein